MYNIFLYVLSLELTTPFFNYPVLEGIQRKKSKFEESSPLQVTIFKVSIQSYNTIRVHIVHTIPYNVVLKYGNNIVRNCNVSSTWKL